MKYSSLIGLLCLASASVMAADIPSQTQGTQPPKQMTLIEQMFKQKKVIQTAIQQIKEGSYSEENVLRLPDCIHQTCVQMCNAYSQKPAHRPSRRISDIHFPMPTTVYETYDNFLSDRKFDTSLTNFWELFDETQFKNLVSLFLVYDFPCLYEHKELICDSKGTRLLTSLLAHEPTLQISYTKDVDLYIEVNDDLIKDGNLGLFERSIFCVKYINIGNCHKTIGKAELAIIMRLIQIPLDELQFSLSSFCSREEIKEFLPFLSSQSMIWRESTRPGTNLQCLGFLDNTNDSYNEIKQLSKDFKLTNNLLYKLGLLGDIDYSNSQINVVSTYLSICKRYDNLAIIHSYYYQYTEPESGMIQVQTWLHIDNELLQNIRLVWFKSR